MNFTIHNSRFGEFAEGVLAKDFVSAVTDPPISHGYAVFSSGFKVFWKSTMDASETETLIRNAAKAKGKRIVRFASQNQAETTPLWEMIR